jgi:hypothetical protein
LPFHDDVCGELLASIKMATTTIPSFTDQRKYQEWSVAFATCQAFRRHDLRFHSAPDDGAVAGGAVAAVK